MHSAIFNDFILPIYTHKILPQKGNHPSILVLGGQPGSGKTALAELTSKELKGNAVMVNIDNLRDFHPKYNGLLKIDAEKAPQLVMKDAVGWMNKLMEHSVKNRLNIIWDNTLGSEGLDTKKNLLLFKTAGYHLDVRVMAVPAIVSKIGILLRYNNDVKTTGFGRILTFENHNARFNKIPANIEMIEKEKITDSLKIYSKLFNPSDKNSPAEIYSNLLNNNEWIKTPVGSARLLEERKRPLIKEEKSVLMNTILSLEKDFKLRKEPLNKEFTDLFREISQEFKTNKGLKL